MITDHGHRTKENFGAMVVTQHIISTVDCLAPDEEEDSYIIFTQKVIEDPF